MLKIFKYFLNPKKSQETEVSALIEKCLLKSYEVCSPICGPASISFEVKVEF